MSPVDHCEACKVVMAPADLLFWACGHTLCTPCLHAAEDAGFDCPLCGMIVGE